MGHFVSRPLSPFTVARLEAERASEDSHTNVIPMETRSSPSSVSSTKSASAILDILKLTSDVHGKRRRTQSAQVSANVASSGRDETRTNPLHVLDFNRVRTASPQNRLPVKPEYLNGGYWPSWVALAGLSPSLIRLDTLTHIHYAFADIAEDGEIYFKDEYLHFEKEIDGVNGCLRAWTQRKMHKPDLKVTLSIGGESYGAPKMFADIAANSRKLYNFLDGVDIDWEEPDTPYQGRKYLGLLATLRIVLGTEVIISIAVGNDPQSMAHLNLAAMSEYVDFFNVISYDFVDPFYSLTDRTGHHAQLFCNANQDPGRENCAHNTIQYMLAKRVPSRKIMLGIPLYGYSFRGASGPYQKFEGPGSGHEGSLHVRQLPIIGMTEVFDKEAVATYAFDDSEFITYDNQDSVRWKAEYVKSNNLLGMCFSNLGSDRFGDESLVRAGHDTLSRTP